MRKVRVRCGGDLHVIGKEDGSELDKIAILCALSQS